jgi:MYXO-CTERM domain-containing protein
LLRGKATAQVSGGTGNASGGGTFASFTNFVGAGFNDRITLAGPGAVTLRVLYSLHSIGSISGEGASTQGGLDVFAFNTGGGPVLTGGRVWHLTPGENTTTLGFDITGTAGDQFTLQGELSIFAGVVRTSVGSSSASLDADHTGLVSIEALSGSFASASGADYAPVPEPGSLLVLGLGALAVRRRRN